MDQEYAVYETEEGRLRIDFTMPPSFSSYPVVENEECQHGCVTIDLVTPSPLPTCDPFGEGYDIMIDLYQGGLKEILNYWDAED
jgi:hypothetical protein